MNRPRSGVAVAVAVGIVVVMALPANPFPPRRMNPSTMQRSIARRHKAKPSNRLRCIQLPST